MESVRQGRELVMEMLAAAVADAPRVYGYRGRSVKQKDRIERALVLAVVIPAALLIIAAAGERAGTPQVWMDWVAYPAAFFHCYGVLLPSVADLIDPDRS